MKKGYGARQWGVGVLGQNRCPWVWDRWTETWMKPGNEKSPAGREGRKHKGPEAAAFSPWSEQQDQGKEREETRSEAEGQQGLHGEGLQTMARALYYFLNEVEIETFWEREGHDMIYIFIFFTLLLLFFSLFILRETETVRVGKDQKDGERERESQVSSELPVQSLMQGSNSQNHEIMTWAKTKGSKLNWLSHPGAPDLHFKKYHSEHLMRADYAVKGTSGRPPRKLLQ